MTFHVGQEVVCIYQGPWICDCCGKIGQAPAYRAVVTIESIHQEDGEAYMGFAAWPDHGYSSRYFRPLVLPKVLTDILAKAPTREVENV